MVTEVALGVNERIDPELGIVRLCTQCGEWWPADPEFFYPSDHGPRKLHSWCKACFLETVRPRRQAMRERRRQMVGVA